MKILVLLALLCPLAFSSNDVVKDFTMPSAPSNSLIRLADYSGKVILINWWRTSCAWSQRESPKLVDLNNHYHNKDFVIVGISDDTADTVSQVPAYLKRYGISWPVGLNDQGEFMREIRPLGRGETPGNYLVSRTGKITYLGLDRGPEDWQKLEKAVAAAVAEPPVKTSPVPHREREPAPAFSLLDLQGRTVRLADFKGKPLVVNFFNAQSCDWAGSVLASLQRELACAGCRSSASISSITTTPCVTAPINMEPAIRCYAGIKRRNLPGLAVPAVGLRSSSLRTAKFSRRSKTPTKMASKPRCFPSMPTCWSHIAEETS